MLEAQRLGSEASGPSRKVGLLRTAGHADTPTRGRARVWQQQSRAGLVSGGHPAGVGAAVWGEGVLGL